MKSIIIDIDGTLSDASHRRQLIQGENKDWEKFFSKVGQDGLYNWCKQIIFGFHENCKIYLVTGRPKQSKDGINVRQKTEAWLARNNIYFDKLIMREEGDFRKDTVVKQEILDEKLPDPDTILFAIDDREDIAEMWRSNGITCLQCKDETEK